MGVGKEEGIACYEREEKNNLIPLLLSKAPVILSKLGAIGGNHYSRGGQIMSRGRN